MSIREKKAKVKTNYLNELAERSLTKLFNNKITLILFLCTGSLIAFYIFVDEDTTKLISEFKTCVSNDGVVISSDACNGDPPDLSRTTLQTCYYYSLFLPWIFSSVIDQNKVRTPWQIIATKSTYMTVACRCLAIFSYLPVSSNFDPNTKKVTYQLVTFEKTPYYTAMIISVILGTLILILYIGVSLKGITFRAIKTIFINSDKQTNFKILTLSILWGTTIYFTSLTSCMFVLAVSNQTNSLYTDVLQPRGPFLTMLSSVSVYSVFITIIEMIIILKLFKDSGRIIKPPEVFRTELSTIKSHEESVA